MEYLIIFVGAVAAAILIFDLMNALTQSALGGQDRLNFGPSSDVDRTLAVRKRSALDAVLIAVWPERFRSGPCHQYSGRGGSAAPGRISI